MPWNCFTGFLRVQYKSLHEVSILSLEWIFFFRVNMFLMKWDARRNVIKVKVKIKVYNALSTERKILFPLILTGARQIRSATNFLLKLSLHAPWLFNFFWKIKYSIRASVLSQMPLFIILVLNKLYKSEFLSEKILRKFISE